MSSTASTIQHLLDLEMIQYRQLFHDMFAKVIGKVQAEVHLKLRQGISSTMIRLPSVRAFSKLPIARTPSQIEIDNYIIAQLQKRDFVVKRLNDNFIEVDWLHLAHSKRTCPDSAKVVTKSDECNKHKEPDHVIKPPPSKPIEPMLIPPRPLPKLTPPRPSVTPSTKKNHNPKPPTKKVAELPVLSNRVERLDDRTEEKMANAHQAVLRALAGV